MTLPTSKNVKKSDKMTKAQIEQARKDMTTNKILLLFSAALLGVLGLMLLYRSLNSAAGLQGALIAIKVIFAIGIAGIIYGIVEVVIEKKNGRDPSLMLINGINIIVISLIMALGMLFVRYYDYQIAIKILYIVLPAVAVLYLIYYTYEREFFMIALISSVCGTGMWLYWKILASGLYAGKTWYLAAVALFAIALDAFTTVQLRRTDGKYKIFGKVRQYMPKGSNYLLINITHAVMAAAFIAALIFGATVAYYLVFVIFGYLAAVAIYYTVKLL